MENKSFWLEKRESESFGPPGLPRKLTNWKLVADEFYRGSEVVFIQITKDYRIMIANHAKTQKTGKFYNRGYVPDIGSVYFYLVGTCLENMIKGLIVYNNPKLIEGPKIDGSLISHNLKTLSKKISGLILSEDEILFLDFLTTQIIWHSKYPMPKDSKDEIGSLGYQIDEVRNVFLSIYNKISRLMEATGELKEHLHKYEFSPNK